MWYVITERLYRGSTGATERFAPRTTTHRGWAVSGPFTRRALAERAAAAAMGTYTCAGAQVVAEAALREWAGKSHHDGRYELETAVRQALALAETPAAE